MHKSIALAAASAAFVFATVAGRAGDDLEWKTYNLVAFPGDGMLSCTGLSTTISSVQADIAQMERVRQHIEHTLESGSDVANHGSRSVGGSHLRNGDNPRQLGETRSAIIASRHVAESRIEYLKTLQPQCKAATGG